MAANVSLAHDLGHISVIGEDNLESKSRYQKASARYS